MRTLRRFVFALLVVFASINHALMAQTDTTMAIGINPYQAYNQDSFGSINEINGVLSGYIPLVSFPQKGSLNLTFYLQFTGGNVWQEFEELPDPNEDRFSVSPTNNFGPVITNNYGYSLQSTVEPFFESSNFTIVNTLLDPQLGSHAMLYDATNLTAIRSYDGSGYAAIDSNTDNAIINPILLPSGTSINDSTIQDVDGNSIQTIASAGGSSSPDSIQDSVGRTIPNISTAADPIGGPQNFPSWATSSTTGCPSLGYPNQPLVGSFAWNVPGANGGTATFLICYSEIHYNNELDSIFSQGTSFEIQSVVLPNKTFWAFEYDSTDSSFSTIAPGNIIQITNPAGGTASYSYTQYIPCSGQTDASLQGYGVQTKTISAGSGNSGTWNYQYFNAGGNAGIQTLITDPLGNQEEINYSFEADACQYFPVADVQYQGSMAGGAIAKQVTTDYSTTSAVLPIDTITTIGGVSTTTNYQYVQSFQTTLPTCNNLTCTPETSLTTPYGMKTDENVIDFSGQKLRDITTHYIWQNNPSYLSSNIMNAVDVSTTFNGSETQVSQTTTSFDEASFEPNPGVRGHPTSVSISNNLGSPIVTHTAWTTSGMVDHTVDGKGVTSEQNTYGAQYDGLYPTVVANALGQTTTYGYDFNTGQVTSIIDANNKTTTNTLYPYGWLMSTNYPDGGSTQFTYSSDLGPISAQNPPATTETIATGEPSGPMVEETIYDGLGRVVQTQMQTNPTGTVFTETSYDGVGNVASVSNPHLSTVSSTDGTTGFTYDALGRKRFQTQPDGTSTLQWSYNGNTVTFTDENNHSWQRTSDALGRLTNVVEPSGASTGYVYDALNNLLTVNQNGVSGETPRVRSFTYDSLSRLRSATNPETGTVSYSNYDANSNLLTKTDARGITTSYSYDALNRLMQKSYSDGTSTVIYGYDGSSLGFDPPTGTQTTVALTNTIGRMSFASGTTNGSLYAFSYDAMGRLKNQWVSTPSFSTTGAVYPISAAYDLAGDVTSLTYPDGRTVNQTWNGGGQLAQVADGTSYKYVSSANYGPNGTMTSIFYGNGVANGINRNSRQQINEMGVVRIGSDAPGTFTGVTNLSVKEICYGPNTPALSSTIPGCTNTPANPNGIPNTGNVWQIMDTLNPSATQNFNYDNLNRLIFFQQTQQLAAEASAPEQNYSYDSFGNLNQFNGSLSTLNTNATYASNNRISNLPCASSTTPYDAAGNQLCDTDSNGAIRQYGFDAESRISQIAILGSSPFESYVYDANGSRIRKTSATGTFTEYVKFGGQTLAERNSDGSWSDYIYANGQRIAEADNFDIRLHMHGTTCSGSSCPANEFAAVTGGFNEANLYTIRQGDVLAWRQYETGAFGGLLVGFTDSTMLTQVARDTDGQFIDADQTMNTWHERTVDMSPYVGKTISGDIVPWKSPTSAPGTWDIYFGDMVLVSTDGTVIPLYTRSLASFNPVAGSGITNLTAITEKIPNESPEQTPDYLNSTTYYSGDQIGSARTLTDGAGWPVASIIYFPFGQEASTFSDNTNPNHYKFTGKERDAESGNDYFGARYYASGIGRFMSPDPLGAQVADPSNPQSLNFYGYTLNNPLRYTDSFGYYTCDPDTFSVNGEYSVTVSATPCSFDFSDFYQTPPSTQTFAQQQSPQFSSFSFAPRNAPNKPPCPVSAASLNAYLSSKNSPLAGQGANLMNSGAQYNIDPRLFVSLAGAETSFGNNITAGQFNAFNVLYQGLNSPFASFQSAINSVGHSLTNPRNGYDFTNTTTLYGHYCSGAGCSTGLKNLNTFMNQQGANTSALHNPC